MQNVFTHSKLAVKSIWKFNLKTTILIAIVFAIFSITATAQTTYTVTSSNDNGAGSLRQTVANATNGSIINFSVSVVNLTGSHININKTLTINGGTVNKVRINAGSGRIFNSTSNFTINNLIIAGASHGSNAGAIEVSNGTFRANNCDFINNRSNIGGALCLHGGGIIIANNCSFSNNTAPTGGAIHTASGTLVAINCTFSKNVSTGGGAMGGGSARIYLYHCTIDGNSGGGIVSNKENLYSFNCIYTGNTPYQISNGISGTGNNLIEGQNGVTRFLVFGNNQLLPQGYIMPQNYALTAQKLASINIVTPAGAGIKADEILNMLNTDQRGLWRPNNPPVTYGAVEIGVPGDPPSYNLQLQTSPSHIGNVTGAGTYDYGDNATIRATTTTPNYYFSHWEDKEGNVISTQAEYKLLVLRNMVLVAVFSIVDYTLQLKTLPSHIGKVSGAAKYLYNGKVNINATTTDFCYYFRHWEDATGKIVSTQPEYTFNITTNVTLTAVFSLKEFAVTIYSNPTYMGYIIGATTGLYNCSEELKLEAISENPDIYGFINWTDNKNNIISTASGIDVLIINDRTVIANFMDTTGIVENDIYDISIVPNPAENDFNIIFNNPEEQNVSISLIDLAGSTVLDIFDGVMPPDKQIYNVDAKIPSGTYFIKFIIDGKLAVRKVVIK
ncbi:MAG: T9SS type A sorting domain-containing protein [Bacteroidetes bacterium]|nr:T9SS type A sorting domain-containing protein [Bacteroidota bacterium]